MTQCDKVNFNLSNARLQKLKSAVKNQTRASLRMTRIIFKGDVPHKLFLTTNQKARLCNVFSNQLATDRKLRKAQISKIIHSGGFLGALLNKLASTIMKIAALAKTFYYH